MLEKLKKG